jgi:hypothetical protein
MSYQLSNRSTNTLQTISKESWSKILSLARFYGWEPRGTLPPFIHNLRQPAYEDGTRAPWDGTYLRNEGQVVQADDAFALAVALQMSLDDIPDVNPERELATDDELPDFLSPAEKEMIRDGLKGMELQDHEALPLRILPFEYFAGDAKQNLAEFIRFCMLGEFIIS